MKFISNYSFHLFSILVIGIGISEAWELRWLCDDAFISFSYAQNFANGIGLVYQPGEFVEGYSNFLWTIILGLIAYIELSPLLFSQIIGIFFYLLLLIFFYKTERNLRPFTNLPIFIIHLALFYHGWIFATSGLETMMFTFFLSFGLVEWQNKTGRERYFFLIAAMTRPEGALFLLFNFLGRKKEEYLNLKIYIPVFIFLMMLGIRFFYYGDLLPNTFYAKANRPAYFSQGLYYLIYWFRVYPLYLPIFFFSLHSLFRKLIQNENPFLSLSIFTYLSYVIYVGGDFMAMRFWIPIIPFMSWHTYCALVDISESLQITSNLNSPWKKAFQKNQFLLYLFFLLSLAVYLNPFVGESKDQAFWNQIGEERRFYENSLSLGTGYDVLALNEFRVAFFGAQAHFIYFMKPKYSWEAESGLTDSLLAKEKTTKPRGRVGHERMATAKGLLERKIELVLSDRFPELDLPFIQFKFREFDWHIFVLEFRANKMKQLCKREGWDCSVLYKELIRRNLDLEKDHILWHD